MPIDVDKVLGAELAPFTSEWDESRIILYHLGVGAGNPPTDPGELAYTYEAGLKVLPSFATVPPFQGMMAVSQVEGLDVNLALLLHGEHEIELPGPIPTSAGASHEGRVTGLYDKQKAAVLVVEVTTTDSSGRILFVNRGSLFLRGEGGFGGDKGPSSPPGPPERKPDHIVESPTLPQQALLYRLNGDRNPLHADPAFAALGGFDRPILHGLATYGIACKAVVDAALGGDVTKVSRYRARFAGVVFPGETIVTRMWVEDTFVHLESVTSERGAPVLGPATVTVR